MAYGHARGRRELMDATKSSGCSERTGSTGSKANRKKLTLAAHPGPAAASPAKTRTSRRRRAPSVSSGCPPSPPTKVKMSTQPSSNSPPATETPGSQIQASKSVLVLSPSSDKSDSSQESGGGLKKPRTQFSPSQLLHLEESFSKNPLPTPKQREQIARRLELTSKHIQVWFQNRRAKDRRKRKREEQEITLKHKPQPPPFWPQNLPFNSNFTAILNSQGKGTDATPKQETSTNQELSTKPTTNGSEQPVYVLTTSASPPATEPVNGAAKFNTSNAGAQRASSDSAQDISTDTQSTPPVSNSDGALPGIPPRSLSTATDKNLSRHWDTNNSMPRLSASSTPFPVDVDHSNASKDHVLSLPSAVEKDCCSSEPEDTASFSLFLSDTGSPPPLVLMETSAGKANDAGSIGWSISQRPMSLPNINHGNGSTSSSLQDRGLMFTCASDSVLCSASSQLDLGKQSNVASEATTPDATESLHSLDSVGAGGASLLELRNPATSGSHSHLNLEGHSPIFAEDPITLANILGDEWAFLDSHLLPMTIHGNQHCPVAPAQTASFPPLSTSDYPHLAPSTVPFPQPEQGRLNSLYHRSSLPPSPSYPHSSPLYHDSTNWPPFVSLPVSLSYSTYPHHPVAIHSNFSSLNGCTPSPSTQRNFATNCVTHSVLPNHLPCHTRH